MVYGVQGDYAIFVGAVYPDHRAIVLESVSADSGGEPELGADDLRTVAVDPGLVRLLPVLAGPPAASAIVAATPS